MTINVQCDCVKRLIERDASVIVASFYIITVTIQTCRFALLLMWSCFLLTLERKSCLELIHDRPMTCILFQASFHIVRESQRRLSFSLRFRIRLHHVFAFPSGSVDIGLSCNPTSDCGVRRTNDILFNFIQLDGPILC